MSVANNPIVENVLQEAIYDWIDAFLPLWDGTGSQNGKPLLTWHMQQAPRPATPLIMARISGLRRIGQDYISRPRNEMIDSVMKPAVQQSGTREFTLYLEYFGPNASDAFSKIVDASQNRFSMGPLESVGICIFNNSSIADAHQFLGTVPEERALVELEMRTSSERIITAALYIIEKVKIRGTINAGTDLLLDTITIDTITV